MFLESDGRWRAALARVTEPTGYFARAHRARSRQYRIDVITVPRIEAVRAIFGLPPRIVPVAAIAFGWPAETPAARTRFRADAVHQERW